MTAKEALRDLVDGLSEEEAARWLERFAARLDAEPEPLIGSHEQSLGRPLLSGKADLAGAIAMLRSWREEGPSMTDEEWVEFTAAFDSHRQHRPIFT